MPLTVLIPRCALIAACFATLASCRNEVEQAQSRWAALDLWEGQRIEETVYRVERDGAHVGRAVLRIYKGNEELSRFGEDISPSAGKTELFRVNLLQRRTAAAGLGEDVEMLDSFWMQAPSLRLRYGTQTALVWNGTIFKEIRVSKNSARVIGRSHILGSTEAEVDLPKNTVPGAALGFFVRAILSSVNEVEDVPVLALGSIWLSAAPRIVETQIRFTGVDTLEILGKPVQARHIEANSELWRRHFWISQERPYLLLQWEGEGGERFVMTGQQLLGWPG